MLKRLSKQISGEKIINYLAGRPNYILSGFLFT